MPEITCSTGAVPEPVAMDQPVHEKLRKAAEFHDRQIVADAEASRTPISDCEKGADSRGDAVWHARSAYRGEAALPSPEPVPVRNAVSSDPRSPSGAARVEQREQAQSGKEAADMGLPCDVLLDVGKTRNRDAELSPTPPFDLIVSAWASV